MIAIKINGIEYDNISSCVPSPVYDYYYDVKKDVTILNYNVSKSQLITIETEKGFRLIKEYLDFTKPLIDYEELYLDKNLYENAIEFIKYMMSMKGENDYFIFIRE